MLYPVVGGGYWDNPLMVPPSAPPADRLPDNECLPAVILLASQQKEKVERLIDYCRRLDGTELSVVILPPKIDAVPHPIGTELAIRYAARLYSNTPWLYVEADSIPLKSYWRSRITHEYRAGGRAFMLPSLAGLSPHDIASAIGVWPPGTDRILPKTFSPFFDFWVYQNKRDDLYLTRAIQHSYGEYDGMRVARRWEFPRDKAILRPDAVIFHADPTQSLIRWDSHQTFFSSGDLGDIIAALPIIKQQGGGLLYLGQSDCQPGPREVMTLARYLSIQPLLALQPYIREVGYMERYDKHRIDRDLSTFRLSKRFAGDNLATWQGRHLGREYLDVDPWLEVGDAPWHGRVVCTRSGRYTNPKFPWAGIVKKYGDRVLFAGTIGEHAEFQSLVRRNVEHAVTSDVLGLARLLKGAALQYSNQSLPWWLGAAMGKRVVQESWLPDPNSVIKRRGLSYTRTDRELARLLAQVGRHRH